MNRPETVVVLVVGDAGFMMSLGDLETAVRYALSIIVVVCNDEALGSEVSILDSLGISSEIARISTPSLASVASSMGAKGYTIRSLDDLQLIAEELREPERPVVLDCRVNPLIQADSVVAMIRHS